MAIEMKRIGKKSFFFLAAACMASVIMGCDYNQQTAQSHQAFEQGNLEAAAQSMHEQATKSLTDDKDHDKLLLNLEDGALQRAAGHLDTSVQALDHADEIYSVFEVGPNVRISQEAAATAINDTIKDYTGYAYDGIMLNTYKALDALELGDMDRTRAELNHASQRQTDAAAKYAKEIADAQKNQPDQQSGQQDQFDVDAAKKDPQFQQQFNQDYADLNVQDLSAYADFVNPFTEYVHGLFLVYAGVDSSDAEKGATTMRRVAGLVKGNPYVAQDAVTADKIANGAQPTPTTYVIYEAGEAPERGQIKIRFPLILRNRDGGGQLIEAAFPTLEKRPSDAEQVNVQAGGANYPTAVVCNMDDVIEQEFKIELPGVIARAMISAAVKAISQYAIDKAGANSNNAFANALLHVASGAFVEASTQADRRTWKSLPKLFSVASLPTPADRNITIAFPNGAVTPVHLQDGVINVVFVKEISGGIPPIIRQTKLK